MISRKQAHKAAESIMTPLKKDLEKRKKKTAERWLRRESPVLPAAVGSLAAAIALEYTDSFAVAVTLGIAIGSGIGGAIRKDQTTSGSSQADPN